MKIYHLIIASLLAIPSLIFTPNAEAHKHFNKVKNITSSEKITKNGFVDEFNLIFKNVNTKGDNSSELKEDYDNKLLSGIVLNREYPLKKINNDTLKILDND